MLCVCVCVCVCACACGSSSFSLLLVHKMWCSSPHNSPLYRLELSLSPLVRYNHHFRLTPPPSPLTKQALALVRKKGFFGSLQCSAVGPPLLSYLISRHFPLSFPVSPTAKGHNESDGGREGGREGGRRSLEGERRLHHLLTF